MQKSNRILQCKWWKKIEHSLMGFPSISLIKHTTSELRFISIFCYSWKKIMSSDANSHLKTWLQLRLETLLQWSSQWRLIEISDWSDFSLWREQIFAKLFHSYFLIICGWHIYFPGRYQLWSKNQDCVKHMSILTIAVSHLPLQI